MLLFALFGTLSASAQEAYAVYTEDNTTLTFYYDNQKNQRDGIKFDVNLYDGHYPSYYHNQSVRTGITHVVFDASFSLARPEETTHWFNGMTNLVSITDIEYLNTECVVNMSQMFRDCRSLASLDLSSFDTQMVKGIAAMFEGCSALESLNLASFGAAEMSYGNDLFHNCSSLKTIYAGNDWVFEGGQASNLFSGCTSLVGGMGTTWSSAHIDKSYARIDGGPDRPGYFTEYPRDPYVILSNDGQNLTFYNDYKKNKRIGTQYDLNTGDNIPQWVSQAANITNVEFDQYFSRSSPTSTYSWFYGMSNLTKITGLEYLNTSEVRNMGLMFYNCSKLESVDESNFNKEKATSMHYMFSN